MSNQTPYLTTGEIVAMLTNVERSGDGWTAHCPAHEDNRNSLSINTGDDGRTLLHCHAGCEFGDMVQAMGLQASQLMPAKQSQQRSFNIVETYDYRNADGSLRYQVCRLDPKDFRQRQPDGNGGWTWKIKGLQPVPYRLPELLADRQSSVFIVEGEKDVDRLTKMGVVATCNSGGAGKWSSDAEYLEPFRDREVIILPDNDEPGIRHAEQVASILKEIAAEIRIVKLPGLAHKQDVSDWIDRGGNVETLCEIVNSTDAWRPTQTHPDAVYAVYGVYASGEWPKPVPLSEHNPPEFPVDALPGWLAEYVGQLSTSTQTPPDLAG